MEAKKTVEVILKEANRLAEELSYLSKKFQQGEMDSIYQDAYLAIYEAGIKAGYDKRESEIVYNPDYLDFQKGVEDGKIIGRQAGRREVVECLNKLADKFKVSLFKDVIQSPLWQDQLIDWEIAKKPPFSPGYVDEH